MWLEYDLMRFSYLEVKIGDTNASYKLIILRKTGVKGKQ